MKSHRTTERLDASAAGIARAAELLRGGGLVAFPTETVYGLGANALSSDAVEGIFAAKQRPSWDPLIVHLANLEMLPDVAFAGATDRELMARFWPGPLTLLLPRSTRIGNSVTAGRPLVGVRMPQHPVALELIRQAGVPLAAPSANRFGHTSPTTAAHVLADLDGRIDAVLDGGPTEVGLESTVAEVDPSGRLVVYRPGAVDEAMLESVLGPGRVSSYQVPHATETEDVEALPSPGVGLRHYAPDARLVLVEVEGAHGTTPCGPAALEMAMLAALAAVYGPGSIAGVMLPQGWSSGSAPLVFSWGPWHQPEVLAKRLFAGLRELDGRGATVIVCPLPPDVSLGHALRDRLRKAAMPRG